MHPDRVCVCVCVGGIVRKGREQHSLKLIRKQCNKANEGRVRISVHAVVVRAVSWKLDSLRFVSFHFTQRGSDTLRRVHGTGEFVLNRPYGTGEGEEGKLQRRKGWWCIFCGCSRQTDERYAVPARAVCLLYKHGNRFTLLCVCTCKQRLRNCKCIHTATGPWAGSMSGFAVSETVGQTSGEKNRLIYGL